MTIEINIAHNLDALEPWIHEMQGKAVTQSVKRAINRTLISVRLISIKMFKKRLNKKQTAFYKKKIKTFKAMGSDINRMQGVMIYDGKTIPLLEFISGSKDIIKQKGIAIKKRRKLRASVKPGKKFQVKGAFIQKVNSKQVFKGKRGQGLKKQGVSSLGTIMQRQSFRPLLEKIAVGKFKKEFIRDLQFRINKATEKVNSARMRKI